MNDIRILQHTSDLDALAELARPFAIASDDPRIQRLVAAAAPHGIEIVVEDAPAWRAGEPARQRLGYIYNGHCFYQFGYFLGPFTDEALGDFAAYLENIDPTEENRMNIYSTELFKYLAGDMIGQREITLTITAVTMEKMNSGRGGEQNKPCLHFRERDKMMVLNKTNAALLAKSLGPETDLWVGGRVTIAAPQIEAFGKTTRTLRVVNVEAAEKPAVTRPATPAPAVVADEAAP